MSRSERLLSLLQILRRFRRPVSGHSLAAELGIGMRTLYRDIATLQVQGAPIEGEAGLGYILRPGFTLPPPMFSMDEIEALVLGSRWVAGRGDNRLSGAATDPLAKIAAVLPTGLRGDLDATNLLAGPDHAVIADTVDAGCIRDAIRNERKVSIVYRDAADRGSERIIWPFALGYFDKVRVIVAWCEARHAVRRQALPKAWRDAEAIAPPRRRLLPETDSRNL